MLYDEQTNCLYIKFSLKKIILLIFLLIKIDNESFLLALLVEKNVIIFNYTLIPLIFQRFNLTNSIISLEFIEKPKNYIEFLKTLKK